MFVNALVGETLLFSAFLNWENRLSSSMATKRFEQNAIYLAFQVVRRGVIQPNHEAFGNRLSADDAS